MINRLRFSKYLEVLINNLNSKSNNIIFIKQFSENIIMEDEIVNTKLINGLNLEVLYYQYNNSELQDAYEPFLSWIRSLYNKYFAEEMTVEEFVDCCDIYVNQRDTFISYISTGVAFRNKGILLNELSYESHRIKRGIISMLEFIAEKVNLIFVLNRFHYANYSALDFIYEFMRIKEFRKIALMVIFDGSNKIGSLTKELWNEMNEFIENNNYLVCWEEKTKDINMPSFNKVFSPKASCIDEYVVKLNNMLKLFAAKQASNYADIIIQKIIIENMNVDRDVLFSLAKICVLIKININDFNGAITLATNMSDMFDFNIDKKKAFEYYAIMSLAYIYYSKNTIAEEYVRKIQIIANDLGEEKYKLKAETIKCLYTFHGFLYMLEVCDIVYSRDVLNYFIENGYESLAGYVYIYSMHTKEEEKKILEMKTNCCSEEEIPTMINIAKNIAKKIGDEWLYSEACIDSVLRCTRPEQFNYMYNNFIEAEEYFIKYNEKNLIGQVYLTIGYRMMMIEKHTYSNDFFNKGLEIFYYQRDVERLGETLYNIGVNCMFINNYEKSFESFTMAYKICNVLELNGYTICKLSKLFGYIALSACYLNDYHLATYYNNKAERILSKFILNEKDFDYWEDDLFLYYLVKGILFTNDNNFEQAEKCYSKARFFSRYAKQFNYFSIYFLATEESKLFNKKGNLEKSNLILDNAINELNKINLQNKISILYDIKNGCIKYEKIETESYIIPLNNIYELCKYENEIKQYNRELKNIDFLYSWQNTIKTNDISLNELINKNLYKIKNNFSLDGIYCFKIKNNDVECIYSDGAVKVEERHYKHIIDNIKEESSAFVLNKYEDVICPYRQLLECFDDDNLVTVAGIPFYGTSEYDYFLMVYSNIHRNFGDNKILLNKEVLQIIKIAFGQFIDAMEIYEADENKKSAVGKLHEMATKDILTGLYNRYGFKLKLQEYQEKYKNKDNVFISTLMYFDLDNFKYYNDTFGHEMGDTILIQFANILKQSKEDEDIAIRYGGDEFILILVEKDPQYAKSIANKVYTKLEEHMKTFIDLKSSSTNFNINNNILLSCSIGISQFSNNSDSFYRALKLADDALYFAKKEHKGTYQIFL